MVLTDVEHTLGKHTHKQNEAHKAHRNSCLWWGTAKWDIELKGINGLPRGADSKEYACNAGDPGADSKEYACNAGDPGSIPR